MEQNSDLPRVLVGPLLRYVDMGRVMPCLETTKPTQWDFDYATLATLIRQVEKFCKTDSPHQYSGRTGAAFVAPFVPDIE